MKWKFAPNCLLLSPRLSEEQPSSSSSSFLVFSTFSSSYYFSFVHPPSLHIRSLFSSSLLHYCSFFPLFLILLPFHSSLLLFVFLLLLHSFPFLDYSFSSPLLSNFSWSPLLLISFPSSIYICQYILLVPLSSQIWAEQVISFLYLSTSFACVYVSCTVYGFAEGKNTYATDPS